MANTRSGIGVGRRVRGVAWGVLGALFLGGGVGAQEVDWRAAFAAGEAARDAGDHGAYARHMAEAVAGLPEGHLNRPFAQYHAARAYALGGDAAASARYLAMAWDEGIEALMITFADHDPAFDAVRSDPAYVEIMGRAADLALEVVPLGGSVHLITGAGSNVLASVGADGVLLVDTGYGAALPAVRKALRALGAGEPDVLIVTHPHEDHWGGAEALVQGTRIMAHPGAVEAMADPYTFMEDVVLPPRPQALRDAVVQVREQTLDFNGEPVRVVGVEAHTGADVAVLFPGSRVLHMGDAYLGGNPMMFPGGQDPDGFLDRLDAFLASLPEGTRVVGGHDAPVGVDAVRAQIEVSRACMAFVREALAEGITVEEAARRAEGRFTAPWVRFFWRALSPA